jgi:hypothetical protein
MNAIDWLTKHRFESVIRREYDWVFRFDEEACLVVECLWRLLEGERIRFTSCDDGNKFGLPAPVDAALEVNQRIANAKVDLVQLRLGTLDLAVKFDSGHVLEVIPNSAGYEAWDLGCRSARFIATGGGELAIFGNIGDAE